MDRTDFSRRTLLAAIGVSTVGLSRPISAQATSSSVAGPTVYATVGGTRSQAALWAVNAATGNSYWTFTATSGGLTPPVSDTDFLYLGSRGTDTDVIALDATTGDRVWERTDIDRLALTPDRGTEQLYVSFQGTPDQEYENNAVYALDPQTGATVWTYEELEQWVIQPVATPDRVFVGSPAGQDADIDAALHALDPTTGERLWRTTAFTGSIHQPVVKDDTAYVSAGETLSAIDVTTGETRWEVSEFSNGVSTPAVTDDLVIVGAGSTLAAVDVTTGTIAWTFTDAVGQFYEPSVAGNLVIAADGESVYALNHETGVSQWRQPMPHGPTQAPAVGANTVYVGGGQKLLAVDRSTGEIIWSIPGFTTTAGSTEWSTPILRDPTTEQSTVPLDVSHPPLPLFVVSDLRSPTGNRAAEGDPTVQATITNQGTTRGTTTVSIAINGSVRASQEISLAAEEETTVTFTPSVQTEETSYLVGVRTADDRRRLEWNHLFTDDVTVAIGPNGQLAFDKDQFAVRPDTTVRFQWASANHNLVASSQPADASLEDVTEIQDSGYTAERTLTVPGEYEFVCQPHQAVGAVLTIRVIPETTESQPTTTTSGSNSSQTGRTNSSAPSTETDGGGADSAESVPGFGGGLAAVSITGASYLATKMSGETAESTDSD